MQARFWVLLFGLVYLIAGIIGFIPALYTAMPGNAPHLSETAASGLLFGLFPVNAVGDAFHIVIGLLAIGMGASLDAARLYSRFLALLFAILTVIGFVPQADVLFGLAPLWGNDTWLHAATALISSYFGFVADEPTNEGEPAAVSA